MSVDRRPVVGVVGHGYIVTRPFGELAVAGTTQAYIDALAAVGCRPVVLPSGSAVELLDVVDAVVLTGGGDVDPALYAGDPALATEVDRARDDHEIAVVEAAAGYGVPLLGVCQGMQVLAVAQGGRLAPVAGHTQPQTGHDVVTADGSLVRDLLGPRLRTSALHHQAVLTAGPHWRPSAWAEDGTIEAVEWSAGDWPALGVQWHPELAWSPELDDVTGPALFGWLRDVASIRAGGPRRRTLVRS